MEDQINILAHNMMGKPAYGLATISQKFEM